MGVFMREPLLDWQREARVVNAKRSTPGSAKDPVSAADTVDPQDMHINLKVSVEGRGGGGGGRGGEERPQRGVGRRGARSINIEVDTICAVYHCSRVCLPLAQLALHVKLSMYSMNVA